MEVFTGSAVLDGTTWGVGAGTVGLAIADVGGDTGSVEQAASTPIDTTTIDVKSTADLLVLNMPPIAPFWLVWAQPFLSIGVAQ